MTGLTVAGFFPVLIALSSLFRGTLCDDPHLLESNPDALISIMPQSEFNIVTD